MNTKCLACGTELIILLGTETGNPPCLIDGAFFRLASSYGSAIIDDMDDKQIVVCDICLGKNVERIDSVKILMSQPKVTYTNFPEIPKREAKKNQ